MSTRFNSPASVFYILSKDGCDTRCSGRIIHDNISFRRQRGENKKRSGCQVNPVTFGLEIGRVTSDQTLATSYQCGCSGFCYYTWYLRAKLRNMETKMSINAKMMHFRRALTQDECYERLDN